MPEDQKSSFSEAVETGASAAHTIRGAIKTGKAISSAAKGAAAGGPYGAVAGAVWAGRKHIGKIIVAVIALLMLPVLFVLMLPGLIFGGLTNAFSPSDPEIPILNSETAIIENANEITFTLNGILGEALEDVLARIEADFAASGADHTFTDGITPVVYYNQLDERYAGKAYGTDNIGGYGCGPTAMAIVVSSLTDDMVDPVEMAEWSYNNGYWCKSSGSYHALIPAAAGEWGLPVSGCTTAEPQRITDALANGKLVVAIMSEGHFTSSGHFIVLRGVKDGKIMVADPASYTRSEQLWDLSIILNEASRRAGAGGPFWIIG